MTADALPLLLNRVPASVRARLDSLEEPWAITGGTVRDTLLGLAPKDLDIITMADVCSLYPSFRDVPGVVFKSAPTWQAGIPSPDASAVLVKLPGIDIWSTQEYDTPRIPDHDFTLNSIHVWSDGQLTHHPYAFADLFTRRLRPTGREKRPRNMLRRYQHMIAKGFWAPETDIERARIAACKHCTVTRGYEADRCDDCGMAW